MWNSNQYYVVCQIWTTQCLVPAHQQDRSQHRSYIQYVLILYIAQPLFVTGSKRTGICPHLCHVHIYNRLQQYKRMHYIYMYRSLSDNVIVAIKSTANLQRHLPESLRHLVSKTIPILPRACQLGYNQ